MIRTGPIQTAIYEALVESTALMGTVSGVFDQPDQNHPFPYVTLGELTGTFPRLIVETGNDVTESVHVWDRNPSMARMHSILAILYSLLDSAALPIIGTQLVFSKIEDVVMLKEPDGETRHAILRVRVETFQ